MQYAELRDRGRQLAAKARGMFDALEPREKILFGVGGGVLVVFMAFFGIFHEKILHWMVGLSTGFRSIPHGWIIIVLLLFVVSFPPMIGYSALSMFTGMVYGFPGGWPVLAFGTVVGSLLSFVTFRYILRDRAVALAHKNVKFSAFSKTLEQDKFTLLWMIRLCPLPYSLSNAALSSIPTIEAWKFCAATTCTTPKLFLHIFIGDRIARLGSAKTTATIVLNILSIVIALGVGILTTYIIYNRTMEKAAAMEASGHYGNVPTEAVVPSSPSLSLNEFDIDSDAESTGSMDMATGRDRLEPV